MKKRTFFITCAILLLSLLIPISQVSFTIILGALFITAIIFLLVTIFRKKLFYSAPKIFTILFILIVGLDLHFTKNLILGPEIMILGNFVAKMNYIIGIVIIGLLALFNTFFIVHFIYKEAMSFDYLSDMNSKLFEIDRDINLTQEQRTLKKEDARKKADYYSHLQNHQKELMKLSLISAGFAILQIIICFLKKYIILEPTVGSAVGFNFIIFLIITMMALSMFKAAKRYKEF